MNIEALYRTGPNYSGTAASSEYVLFTTLSFILKLNLLFLRFGHAVGDNSAYASGVNKGYQAGSGAYGGGGAGGLGYGGGFF